LSIYNTQVPSEHYDFLRYVDKRRWASFYHQIQEIFVFNCQSVLEVGVGTGILGALLKHFGLLYHSVDIDAGRKPTYVGSVLKLPLADSSYDIVVCFQVLEHIRYQDFVPALRELSRVGRGPIIISLPDAGHAWSYKLYIPILGSVKFLVELPRIKLPKHIWDGQHYWEINTKDYPLKRIIDDIEKTGLRTTKTYRVHEKPRHRFFVLDDRKK
jgi:SAM-dependent methyltransferase